ncbi:hypothetical protein JD844_034073 [Phrynosoma platyrhinos]|uniref:Uncharacterized protein n=1 Tax=Phrynosoma platyrhinos TaxID=52577 RepID=A0ABQ7T830_PHRPL|nr:hypothetical protein JD844_034073 [Phrynosoma platyrhinos]
MAAAAAAPRFVWALAFGAALVAASGARVNETAAAEKAQAAPGPEGPATTTAATATTPGFSSPSSLGVSLSALHRALYVMAVMAAIGLLYYLGGRALRTRKPPRKKYGLLSNSEDPMEMASLESDEDTVFETKNLRR